MGKKIIKPLHDYNLIDIFRLLNKYWKLIAILTVIGAISSIAISLLLPKYYKSTSIIYPVSMTNSDRSTIFGQQQSNSEHSYFGNKYDANRILQVANSSKVIDYIINKYNLSSHYEYGKNDEYVMTKVKEEFLDNYYAIKNDKDAIEIALLDTDRRLAAEMLNDLVSKIDEIISQPVQEGKEKIIKMLKLEISKKEEEINSNLVSNFQKENIKTELKQLSNTLTQYEVSANEKQSALMVLEKAEQAERKFKPVRWIIVVMGTIGTFLLSILSVIAFTQYKYIKKKL